MPDNKSPLKTPESTNKLLERVSKTAEVITSPESPTLVDFYNFVKNFFRPEEMEPLEVYQRELVNNNPNVHYILTALRDPAQQNKLISAAYGSVQNGVLTGRFILTDSSYQLNGLRSTGVGQKALDLLFSEAERFCKQKNMDIRAFAGAALKKSEGFYNRQEIEPGNGMKRIYFPGTIPDETNHIHYEIPPLAWNTDGAPTQKGVSEYLQIAVKGYPEKVPVIVLEEILRGWWNVSYIRPRDQFSSDEAWELHKKTVWDILEEKILAPMRRVSELKLMSKKDREFPNK